MKSKKIGKSTLSKSEVTGVTSFGIWLIHNEREYFLDYDHFPWFKSATIEQITFLTTPSPTHLRWPKIDVDLELESLTKLDQYPLKYI